MISVDIVLVAKPVEISTDTREKVFQLLADTRSNVRPIIHFKGELILIRDGRHVFARFHKRSKCQIHIGLIILTLTIEDAGKT